MKELKKYFIIWWIPIIAYIIPYVIYILGTLLKNEDIIDIALVFFFLNILGNIVSGIVQIYIKKWFLIIPQFFISSFLFFSVSVYFTFSPPDYYGANKIIPKNIKFDKPLNRELKASDLQKNDFELAEISQPGIYNYYTNYQPKELGKFFIKAYEITSNERLSEERITHRSKIIIDSLNRDFHSGEFTIYEGSWGDKYGAKIELWYEPNTGKSYKVAVKNYIVEGWMR
jgi:hypothetical protein